ncbi:hypothetical protein SmJEL517_g01063 [Synchytrium microbalum]|uniref:Uncharacterized protein n=1 Tax=Synchytrium microbalum TaxID=1806994 RepID=A0A507C5Z1_9FUNG|nr:uncharacterized protein SmJEL517_g01063 [Synchytrium microbalum]TPX37010.1 hypothetical protein SmJEL517_g01063 [Synchytrium microbalum]
MRPGRDPEDEPLLSLSASSSASTAYSAFPRLQKLTTSNLSEAGNNTGRVSQDSDSSALDRFLASERNGFASSRSGIFSRIPGFQTLQQWTTSNHNNYWSVSSTDYYYGIQSRNSIRGQLRALVSDIWRVTVLKATVAYLVATMFTFVEPVSVHFGRYSYLTAMAICYFHPARSVGAMVEALLYCLAGVTFGSLVSVGALHIVYYYENEEKERTTAHLLILGVLAMATFVLAYVRAVYGQKRPSISTGTTLAHLITFVTITQMPNPDLLEFQPDKILRVSMALVVGTVISFSCCCLISPYTASSELKKSIAKALANLRKFFDTLASSVSLNTDSQGNSIVFNIPIPNHQGAAAPASPSPLESLSPSDEQEPRHSLDTGVDVESIASHHDQLSSLIKEHQTLLLALDSLRIETKFETLSAIRLHYPNYIHIFDSISRLTQHLSGLKSSVMDIDRRIAGGHPTPALTQFLEQMGPYLRRLISTARQAIALVAAALAEEEKKGGDNGAVERGVILPALITLERKLGEAVREFDVQQKRVLVDLYEKVNEDVFLVYFFVFALMEVGSELQHLVENIADLRRAEARVREAGKVQFWLASRPLSTMSTESTASPVNTTAPSLPHTPGLQDASRSTVFRRLMALVWIWATGFRAFEIRFAIKTAATIALLSLPGFINSTQDWYYEYRMWWALTSVVVVLTPSVGGTNAAGMWRIVGTIGGALAGCLSWVMFPNNPLLLWLVCGIVAVPAFYVFLHTKYAKIGQVFLMTYTIVLLNRYANPLDQWTGRDIGIEEFAYKRGIAVVVGVVVGLFVSWYVWPYKARDELRKILSSTLFDMGVLYSKLVSLFTSTLPPTSDEFFALEISLRNSLTESRALLTLTRHEPRIKGRFPTVSYDRIITALNDILDRFVSMRVAAWRGRDAHRHVRHDFVGAIEDVRREMVGAVLLYFYVLAGALVIKSPLPPQLPNADAARVRLVSQVRELPMVREMGKHRGDSSYLYYYSYILAMEDVIREMELLGALMKGLFGEISYEEMTRHNFSTGHD